MYLQVYHVPILMELKCKHCILITVIYLTQRSVVPNHARIIVMSAMEMKLYNLSIAPYIMIECVIKVMETLNVAQPQLTNSVEYHHRQLMIKPQIKLLVDYVSSTIKSIRNK